MPRVAGVDPGTVTIDVCVLDDGRLAAERSWSTAAAVGQPEAVAEWLLGQEPELVAGPSGYGLPLVRADRASEEDWRLAFLAPPGEPGGIGGLRKLSHVLTDAGLSMVFLPGVVHLDTVPRHRKLNRVDLGTADKVCTAALAVAECTDPTGTSPGAVSLLLLEFGGAFTAALAVQAGRIVDGYGGTSGPPGWRSGGAWDGEVAFLAERVTKAMLFEGGVETVSTADPALAAAAVTAAVEGAAKAAHALAVSAPDARRVVLSGRHAATPGVRDALAATLGPRWEIAPLGGFAAVKHAAQGAALLADGLAGGRHRALVETMRIAHASGTVLDHLFAVPRSAARRRLGLPSNG
jgi:predicted butyrate kinase (DUF1464 family)